MAGIGTTLNEQAKDIAGRRPDQTPPLSPAGPDAAAQSGRTRRRRSVRPDQTPPLSPAGPDAAAQSGRTRRRRSVRPDQTPPLSPAGPDAAAQSGRTRRRRSVRPDQTPPLSPAGPDAAAPSGRTRRRRSVRPAHLTDSHGGWWWLNRPKSPARWSDLFIYKFSSNVCLGRFAGSEPSLSIACCAGPDPTTRSRNSSVMAEFYPIV